MGALTKKKKIYKWVRRPGIDVLVPGAGFSLACCPQKSALWRREEATGENWRMESADAGMHGCCSAISRHHICQSCCLRQEPKPPLTYLVTRVERDGSRKPKRIGIMETRRTRSTYAETWQRAPLIRGAWAAAPLASRAGPAYSWPEAI